MTEPSEPGEGGQRGSAWSARLQRTGGAIDARTAEAARRLAVPIARTTRVLRIPSWLFGFGASVPPLALVPLALSWQLWPKVVGLTVCAAAIVVVAWFWYRRLAMLRAVRDVDAFTGETAHLLSVTDLGGEVYSRLEAAAQRGGIGLMRRMAAIWRVIQIPSVLADHIEEHPRVRWFVPPRLLTTWTLVVATAWVGVVGWVLVAVAYPLSATPVL
ncbi:hypothetical protein Bcav_1416 [Beutenbergia cavernae DSM 12333]|uniref:Uncharacterized protein n=1 Tax=Beutenbergia cavernae (strain ATCC BAA-8 / DSM 12333 / CCUG 43141 / JCM 11478 / NBRC 16432 / NCIMB 13614 / HKI 0122) TaxID=471853 RepID=C5C2I8_BEUC1|nr:hypothetical protein [Beutenbergia cavernae]ACQ79674.1 hypothetical protein Bcav_1416 [Beutenbergia cavernae DSM 12333]